MSKTSAQRLRERLERRATIRDKITEKLQADLDRLTGIQERLKVAGPNLAARQIQALKLECEIIFKKLAKILPDEKVVEHDLGDNVVGQLTDDELESRVAELLRKAGIARIAPAQGEAATTKPN